jgi:uncharacterized membrane protein YdbT with pleckstrin-like domain
MSNDKKEGFELKKSRKAFIWEYTCGVLLLIILFTSYLKEINIHYYFQYFILILAIFCFAYAELNRLATVYLISEHKITIMQGLISKNKKHVDMYAVGFLPDINVSQTLVQRVLNFGSIYVENGGKNAFTIKDINNPQGMMEKIEQLIKASRINIHKHGQKNNKDNQ